MDNIGLGLSEILVIGVIALIVYGKELPTVARKVSKFYHKLRRQLTDIKDDLRRQIPEEEFNKAVNSLDPSTATEPPAAPTGLVADPTEEQVYLTWDTSLDATTYTLKRAEGNDDAFLTIAADLPDSYYTDAEITPGVRYRYTVTASNAAGESPACDEIEADVPDPGPDADGNGTSKKPARKAKSGGGRGGRRAAGRPGKRGGRAKGGKKSGKKKKKA